MKWSMFLRDGAMQVNLEAENAHEQKALDILLENEGVATIHAGVDIGMCRGGYLRNFGESSKSLAITIRKPDEDDGPPPPK